jgi:DNA-binding NarL/FixJ family response regulator
MEKKNIVLVDDHIIVRNGLKELIEKLGAYSVQSQFDSGEDFLKALPIQPTPDLVIMDLNMPVLSGEEVVEIMNGEQSDLPVLILTLNEDEATIIRLFRNGVKGYLKKDCTAEELKTAIDSVINYGYYHNEFLTLSLRNNTIAPAKNKHEEVLEQLTELEKEFLKLVCHEDEYTYDQIADKMGKNARAVDNYRESIFGKFAIKSKTGLVLFVLKHQLMEHL